MNSSIRANIAICAMVKKAKVLLAIIKKSHDPTALRTLAFLLLSGKTEEAVRNMIQVMKSGLNNISTYCSPAAYYYKNGKLNSAREEIRNVKSISPEQTPIQKAGTSIMQGNKDVALLLRRLLIEKGKITKQKNRCNPVLQIPLTPPDFTIL